MELPESVWQQASKLFTSILKDTSILSKMADACSGSENYEEFRAKIDASIPELKEARQNVSEEDREQVDNFVEGVIKSYGGVVEEE